MARIRSIKPDFFVHDGLAELSLAHRMLFIGLWTQADREGRLEDRPARIKVAVLPYDDLDVDALLWDLAEHRERFVVRYEVDGVRYLQVTGFKAHQQPHIKEVASKIPDLQAGTILARCKPVSPESRPDNPAPVENTRKGAIQEQLGSNSGAGGEGKVAEGAPAALAAAAAAEVDLADCSSDVVEAAVLCHGHPYLREMLDPAVTLVALRSGYPDLPLVATLRKAIAALTPERIAEQRNKGGPASRYLSKFFEYQDRDRVREATAPPSAGRPSQHAADRTMDAIHEAFGSRKASGGAS